MKKSKILLYAIAIVIFAKPVFATTGAVRNDYHASITVTGSGEVTLTPDVAHVSIGISTTDDTANLALERNNSKTEDVIAAIISAGIDSDEITTTNFSIRQQTAWDSGVVWMSEEEISLGYIASNNLQVTIHDLDIVGHILSVATNAGASSIINVSFGIRDSEEAYGTALALAVQSAQRKAEIIANTTGSTIAGVVSVTETGGNFMPTAHTLAFSSVSPQAIGFTESFSDVPFQVGDLTVRANVTIVYALY